ncbi:MalY/PatB family protein [Ferrimonas aestuarii]|uniref:cysteine-S-conjugate beta-lyase n=1 Tax=Ferrimonas aestuarii TaxID=2569539 RepID=A0A4U1BMF9_9GAMM|nr:PatB family C-S lyase [Ferrimonas aestuarii]TKB52731.1 putative C-S lyase [Ferrimonas aestuarii]
MFKTEPNNPELSNKFIKSDANMLNQIYGTSQVTPYWIADMAFPVAAPITQAMQHLVDRQTLSYEFDSETLFQLIADWNRSQHGLGLNPKRFVQTPRVLSAIALVIREFTEEGDGVLIQTPVYHQFHRLISSAGRQVIENPLALNNGHYEIDFEHLTSQIQSGKVKMILLCNPHNPVGRVWSKDEMRRLVELARQRDVLIVSDEVHGDIVFDDKPFISLASVDYRNAITLLGSPAKNFGLNSIANGYLYVEDDGLYQRVKDLVSSMALDHGNAFSTYATIAAYKEGQPWFEQFVSYTQNNRDWLVQFIQTELPDVEVTIPEGTNQIWLNFSGLGLEDEALKSLLTIKAKLALTPGSWFGEKGSHFYRMNFAVPLSQLKVSMLALKVAVEER